MRPKTRENICRDLTRNLDKLRWLLEVQAKKDLDETPGVTIDTILFVAVRITKIIEDDWSLILETFLPVGAADD